VIELVVGEHTVISVGASQKAKRRIVLETKKERKEIYLNSNLSD
jgi:hypothetical protein